MGGATYEVRFRVRNMWQGMLALFQPQPEVFQAKHRFLALLGLAATFGYAFSTLQSTTMEMWTHNVMVLALLVSLFWAPRVALTQPVMWMIGVTIFLGLFSYAQTHLLIPEFAEPKPELHKLLAVFVFLPVAWWLGGSDRRVFVLLALALVGFLATLVVHATPHEVRQLLDGKRVAFGFHNAQHTAMFFSTALLGWSVFSVRILSDGRPLRYAVWGVVLALLVAGVFATQTRAAWLGLAGAAAVVGGLGVVGVQSGRAHRKTALITLVVAVLTLAIAGWFFGPMVERRLATEDQTFGQIASGQFEEVRDTSLGMRIKLWREAARWVSERPLVGWGYTIRSRFIEDSQDLSERLKRFGHVHSSYLEIILIYGAVGLAVFSTLVGLIGAQVWKSWRKGETPTDVALFGFGFFAFWLVVNAFESYVFGKTGTYLVAIVLGSVYTYPLAATLRLTVPAAECDTETAVPAGGGAR